MWEFVDKIVYINLDHRKDRIDVMAKFFAEGGVPMEKVERFSAIKRANGRMGCLESHTKVLLLAKQNQWKNVLILEDDLEWVKDFEENYKKLEELFQKPDWDVIMLTGWYWKHDFPRIFSANNTGAYLVNSSYYDKLLENRSTALKQMGRNVGFYFQTKQFNADVSWKKLMEKDIWYGLQPCICRQIDGYSDICKKDIKSSKIVGLGTRQIKREVYG
jgi:glycosyl transferase family 25